MAEAESMEFYEARLKTFQGPRTTGRKRTSTAKGGIGSKWNLTNPSATQLAQAGFYYAPTAPGSDNVTCFCCEKSLDGWEEGDNPFSEHLHFSPGCAWAILMAVENNANEELQGEDPMSERMLEARRQTFRDQWPHERKRGWTCKIQKMIEGGWYFYPSSGADDQANCVYCKRSLLGWEPKDKPYDEHKKRSPDCAFFSGSQTMPVTKAKKTAASRTARASLQSVTANSIHLPEIVDVDDDVTQASTMTVDTSTVSTTSKAKKGPKSKKATSKNTRSKNLAVSAETEEPEETEETVPAPPARGTRGKKRTSDQIQEDSVEVVEPPKKRVTRAKANTQAASRNPSPEPVDITMEDTEPSAVRSKKGAKGGKKCASSTARKASSRVASTRSVLPETAPVPAIPIEDDIDAELAADLERFNSDDDSDNWKVLGNDDSIVSQIYKPQTTRTSNIRTQNTKANNKTNSSAIEHYSNSVIAQEASPTLAIATSIQAVKTKPGRKQKQTAKTKLQQQPVEYADDSLARKQFEESLEADDNEDFASALELRESSTQNELVEDVSQLTVAAEGDDPNQQTKETTPVAESPQVGKKNKQRSSKSTNPARKAPTKGKAIKKRSVEVAFEPHQEIDDIDVAAELEALEAELEAQVSRILPQPVAHTSENETTQALAEGQTPRGSRQPRGQVMSPEASPQSSDAENRPPSSRPSQTRPPLSGYSPTESRTVRVPLAPSTPTASPSKRNVGLQTTYPWTPADIDYILNGTPVANRENVDLRELNSEEKKMTLEDWIKWNAKKNEDRLKADCEMMVGKFESEGVRALKTLEGIISSDS